MWLSTNLGVNCFININMCTAKEKKHGAECLTIEGRHSLCNLMRFNEHAL